MQEERTLDNIFYSFVRRASLFVNRNALHHDFFPEKIVCRDREIEELAKMLAPALRGELPSNIFVYGKTGTGKTLVVRYVGKKLEEAALSLNVPVSFIYVNAGLRKIADTEYRFYSYISNLLGFPTPKTGLPTDQIYEIFLNALDSSGKTFVIAIDEIDLLIRKSPEVLYTLTRINSELNSSRVSIIGITNSIRVLRELEPRIRSSLSKEEVFFAPYDANQLARILEERAKIAFRKDAVAEGVIERCAAYAAREHGDARKALDLLRVAGEIAEREGALKVMPKHVDLALEAIDRNRVLAAAKTLPQHSKILLYLILRNGNETYTGELYSKYTSFVRGLGIKPLTLRRVGDIINELESLGLISADVISKGRYGRTRIIVPQIYGETKEKVMNMLEAEFM